MHIFQLLLALLFLSASPPVFAEDNLENRKGAAEEKIQHIIEELGEDYLRIVNDGFERTMQTVQRQIEREGNGTIWMQSGAETGELIRQARLRADWMQRFFQFDLDADNEVEQAEIARILSFGGSHGSASNLFTSFVAADADQNEIVTMKEWEGFIEPKVKAPQSRRNSDYYLAIFDWNDDGATSLIEASNIVLVLTGRKEASSLEIE